MNEISSKFQRMFSPARQSAVLILSAGLVLLCAFFLSGNAAGQTVSTAPLTSPGFVFPGDKWEKFPSPEAAGYSRAGIEAVIEFLKPMGTTGLVVVCDGKILLEYGETSDLSYLASVRKSVLAMLYGKAVADGRVRLDKTLAELKIDDNGGLSDKEREATIADLLSARSGVYHPASNAGDNLASAPPRGSQKHGAYFLYSNWDFNALGTIFEQETGRNIYDALEQDLARPLQMQDFQRDAQQKGGDLTRSVHPAYHIWLSTRDMARLGYLMLREGNWNGRSILPRDWVRKISSPITRSSEMNPEGLRNGRFGYGHLWWIFDGPRAVGPYEGAYTGWGVYGQYITVFPKLNLVVAHKVNPDKTQKTVSMDQYLALLETILAARAER